MGVEAPETGGFSHLTGPAGGVLGSSGMVRGRVLRTPGSLGVAWPQNGGRKRSEASRENIDKGGKQEACWRFNMSFFFFIAVFQQQIFLEETGIENLKLLSISLFISLLKFLNEKWNPFTLLLYFSLVLSMNPTRFRLQRREGKGRAMNTTDRGQTQRR